MSAQSPVLVARDDGEHFHFLDTLYTAKVTSEQSLGALTAMEFLAPRNFAPPVHRHRVEDELFYVLDGELWVSCGDVEAVHGAGAVVWLPRGVTHCFQVRSETARIFQVSTPGQFERFVAALGVPTPDPVLPEPAEVDPARLVEVCGEFGIEVLGPPPAAV
jgi:mannose-6-phosphate isomerase-like protein (cupin superfamily)